ncbi:MAG: hypothetical protein JSV86_09120 [Gemmatimonadota bacterium]|nr:MAG: hypothetical protein JSV86_09120 [Gemmatimonadota bacterium]
MTSESSVLGIGSALPLALMLLALQVLPASAVQVDRPNLSGSWVLNEEESDNPREQMRPASGSGMQGRQGGGMRGRPPGGDPRGDREQMRRLMEGPHAFKILQDDSTVTIVTEDGMRLVLFPDGQEREDLVEGLGATKLTADWQGGKLVVARKSDSGPEATQSYELSDDGGQLVVRVRIEHPQMPRPIEFRRVYDPSDDAA